MSVYVKVKVMIKGHVIDMTLDELRELRDEIDGVLDEKKPFVPYSVPEYPNNIPFYDWSVPWGSTTNINIINSDGTGDEG